MADPTPADRMALALCVAVWPISGPCQSPCGACRQDAAAVAADHTILDRAICAWLRRFDGHATNNEALIALAGGRWRTVDARMQAMRRSGRIRWHGRSTKGHPLGVRSHGWEVLPEPGAQPGTVQTVQEVPHG